MSKKHKKVCTTLNYTERFLILVFAVNGSILIFVLGISIGTKSSAIGLKTCAITAEIKKL